MKTKAKSVKVLVLLCDIPVTRTYPIRTKSGHLMTNRLEQLIHGNLSHSHGRGIDDHAEVEFVGVSWESPYTIWHELVQDRIALQAKILALDGHSALTDYDASIIPISAPDNYVSEAILDEIKLRKALKHELRLLEKR